MFYAVYQESLYEINAENLRLIGVEILNITDEYDIVHKNYTLLLAHPNAIITQYINRNINEYFDVVLQMSRGNILDDENIAVSVLNNSELTVERKHTYISCLQTTIVRINKIADHALWSTLLDADIVQYSECNIMDCFNALKLNENEMMKRKDMITRKSQRTTIMMMKNMKKTTTRMTMKMMSMKKRNWRKKSTKRKKKDIAEV